MCRLAPKCPVTYDAMPKPNPNTSFPKPILAQSDRAVPKLFLCYVAQIGSTINQTCDFSIYHIFAELAGDHVKNAYVSAELKLWMPNK